MYVRRWYNCDDEWRAGSSLHSTHRVPLLLPPDPLQGVGQRCLRGEVSVALSSPRHEGLQLGQGLDRRWGWRGGGVGEESHSSTQVYVCKRTHTTGY